MRQENKSKKVQIDNPIEQDEFHFSNLGKLLHRELKNPDKNESLKLLIQEPSIFKIMAILPPHGLAKHLNKLTLGEASAELKTHYHPNSKPKSQTYSSNELRDMILRFINSVYYVDFDRGGAPNNSTNIYHGQDLIMRAFYEAFVKLDSELKLAHQMKALELIPGLISLWGTLNTGKKIINQYIKDTPDLVEERHMAATAELNALEHITVWVAINLHLLTLLVDLLNELIKSEDVQQKKFTLHTLLNESKSTNNLRNLTVNTNLTVKKLQSFIKENFPGPDNNLTPRATYTEIQQIFDGMEQQVNEQLNDGELTLRQMIGQWKGSAASQRGANLPLREQALETTMTALVNSSLFRRNQQGQTQTQTQTQTQFVISKTPSS